MAKNERLVKAEIQPAERATALTWLFHLAGDIHQPLHTAQLFTVEYPNGDRGGNEICVRAAENRRPMKLHAFWDGLVSSSSNVNRLKNEATKLKSRTEFARRNLSELAAHDFEAWGKESFKIAVTIAYQNGALRGTPRAGRRDCGDVMESATLPPGYASSAGAIAHRRITLAGFRLADALKRLFGS